MVKKLRWIVGTVLLVGFGTYTFFNYYSFLFARKVEGEIFGVERVTNPAAVISGVGAVPTADLHSYAIAIKDLKNGEIVSSSGEDRQWSLARKGLCVEARFYPYPPWNLEKAGTYYNARMVRLYECGAKPSE